MPTNWQQWEHVYESINIRMVQPSSFDINSNLVDESNSVFVNPASEQYWTRNMQDNTSEQLTSGIMPEQLSLYYCDPQGEFQGPFHGVDIISY